MSAVAQWENRTTRRDDFKSKNGDSAPTLREIRSNSVAVRRNWTPSERQLRAQMAQLLQQQLLDSILSLPFDATQQACNREASVA